MCHVKLVAVSATILVDFNPNRLHLIDSGRGAAWLAHQHGGLGVGGSNPLAPSLNYDPFLLGDCGAFTYLATKCGVIHNVQDS